MANKGVHMMKQIFVYEGKVIHDKQRHIFDETDIHICKNKVIYGKQV